MAILQSGIVPPDLSSRYSTVSEALLDLSPDVIGGLKLDAPLVCSPEQRVIVPFELVVTTRHSHGLGIREWLMWKLVDVEESARSSLLETLFPPHGPIGFWDQKERVYRTRYMARSLLDKPAISEDLVRKHDLRDALSYWNAVIRGQLLPYFDSSIEVNPPTLNKPTTFLPETEIGKYLVRNRLLIAYRGCQQIYDYPFRPSAYRRFQSNDEGQQFQRIDHFANSLITEFVWTVQRVALMPNESASIAQHYKLLPWSLMVDVSFDVNVAKAFASQRTTERDQRTSCLYTCVLYNVDFYDSGASLIHTLPFERPKVQNAVSLTGLGGSMEDATGVIVALTEHPLYYTSAGTTWDLFGGQTFKLGGRSFNSPFLAEDESKAIREVLYPRESPEAAAILCSVIAGVRRNIHRFGLDEDIQEEVISRFDELEGELE